MTPLPRPVWPGRPRQDEDPKPAQESEQDWWLEQLSRDWEKLVEAQMEHEARVAELEAKRAAQHRQPRRITQLCGSAEGVHALCDDGTVWQLIGGVWAPEPAIPQRQLAED